MCRKFQSIALTVLVGLLLAASPASAAPANEATPGLLAKLPDGRKLNFRCSGQGSPTVLLEGGYGASSLVWTRVQAQVAKTNRVCAYDRAGYGFSDPGPLPRDGAAIARDLDRGLRAAKINGPFIVVGHSAGGLYVRLFSNRRPEDVVGMVLVDPSVEYQEQRFSALFGPGAGSVAPIIARDARCLEAAQRKALPSEEPGLERCTPKPDPDLPAAVNAARLAEAMRPSKWRTLVSELETLWSSTSDEIKLGRQSYGDMPLIVLTAGQTYASAPEQAREPLASLWWGLHREIAERSDRGVSRRIIDSPHMMITQKPEVVVAAILDVSAQTRSQAKP